MTPYETDRWEHNPGSLPARKLGCKCPYVDNHAGRGRGGDGKRYGWYISGNCPMHLDGQPQSQQEKSP
jgi:hypothetical protein